MFPFPVPNNEVQKVEDAIKESKSKIKKEHDDKMVYRSSPKLYSNSSGYGHSVNEFSLNAMDTLLETEKNKNKTESWNKLDKTVKIQKLHMFAEKYGKDFGLPMKDVKALKMFFIECLEKNKLSKTKDMVYSKDTCEIVSIPSLHFNSTARHFTLKNMDPKRVSTLKALTPRAYSKMKETIGTDGQGASPPTTKIPIVEDDGDLKE